MPGDKEQGRLKALLPVLTEEIQAGLDYAKDRKTVKDNEDIHEPFNITNVL